MNWQPPRWLEWLATLLIPPASREHALGDLAESSHTTSRYVANLASILPRVVWCQIRRRARLAGIAFNAVLTAIALSAAVGVEASPGLAQPWVIWVVGSALASAYGPRDKPLSWNSWLFFSTFLLALASAALAGLPVTRVAIGLGAVVAFALLMSMPWVTSRTRPPLTLDTLPQHARQFQRTIWWRNARESAAALIVLALQANDLWKANSLSARVGPLLIVAGVLFIVYYLHVHASPRTVPDADVGSVLQFHRDEIARQRDILKRVPLWYLLPFVPGMIATMAMRSISSTSAVNAAAAMAASVAVLMIFVLVWLLNVWGARYLDKQLQAVNALDSGSR